MRRHSLRRNVFSGSENFRRLLLIRKLKESIYISILMHTKHRCNSESIGGDGASGPTNLHVCVLTRTHARDHTRGHAQTDTHTEPNTHAHKHAHAQQG